MSTNDTDDMNFESVDIGALSEERRYKFLMGAVVPRPIALVTSLSESGVLNAAPFSQYVVISVSPPLLGIVAHESAEGYKDTVRNVIASGEFVINSVCASMAVQVQVCSEPFAPEVSEVAQAGLNTLPSMRISPARIAESPLHFECRLHKAIPFGHDESTTMLIVGEVLLAHGVEGVVSGHRIDHRKFNPLGRIAGRAYCLSQETIHV